MIILPANITSTCLSPVNITSTHYTSWASWCNFGGKRYCDCFLVQNEMYWVHTWKKVRILNFGIGILIWQFFNSGILKQFLTGISGIGSGIGILLLMGVPGTGTKNQNSQPSCKGWQSMLDQQLKPTKKSHLMQAICIANNQGHLAQAF